MLIETKYINNSIALLNELDFYFITFSNYRNLLSDLKFIIL